MSFKNASAEILEAFGNFGQSTVRSGDFKSLIEQNFRDTAHTNAADTDKM
jgi:hypothetical protein